MRPRDHAQGRRGRGDPRRPRGRVQPRLHLPEGLRAQGAARRLGPRHDAADPAARRQLRRGDLGRGVCADRRAPVADPGRGPQRRRRVPRQPERPQPRQPALRPRAAPGDREPQPVLGQHRRSVPQADGERADVRDRHHRPRAGPRPHRLPADARRQPAAVERQPDDLARCPRPAPRDPRPRRQAGRDRPAPDAHGRGGR